MVEAFPVPFDPEEYLPRQVYDIVCDVRSVDPTAVYKATQTRQPRKQLTTDGRLLLVVCDTHAAGPAWSVSRYHHLSRIIRVILGGVADGVVATADMIEDLCLVQQILRENGGPAFLDGKALIGSITGSVSVGHGWVERWCASGLSVERARHFRCDGVWLRLPVDPSDVRGPAALEACAALIEQANTHQMTVFVEPIARGEAADEPDCLARCASMVSGIGDTSSRTWLAFSFAAGLPEALDATSLPVVVTDGPSETEAGVELLRYAEQALAAGRTVRGFAFGPPVLWPGDDPLAICGAVQAILRRGASVETLIERLDQARGKRLDAITSALQGKELRFEAGLGTASYIA